MIEIKDTIILISCCFILAGIIGLATKSYSIFNIIYFLELLISGIIILFIIFLLESNNRKEIKK